MSPFFDEEPLLEQRNGFPFRAEVKALPLRGLPKPRASKN
jgi:hypothetical protein